MKLQFELSYLDKPYGARDIIHPKTGRLPGSSQRLFRTGGKTADCCQRKGI